MRPMSSRFIYAFCAFIYVLLSSPQVMAQDDRIDGAPSFVTIDEIIFSVVQNARVHGLMSVTIKLQIRSEAERNDVQSLRPKLRDNYLSTLTHLGRTSLAINRPVNFELLRRLLQKDTDNVLGKEKATVFITDVSTRASTN